MYHDPNVCRNRINLLGETMEPLSSAVDLARLANMDPLIRGWDGMQQFACAASAQRFFRPTIQTTVMFLGEPVAIVVDSNYSVVDNPTSDQIASAHVLINAYVPEQGTVMVVGGDTHLYYQLLQAYYEHGVADWSYSIDKAAMHLRSNRQYTGPQLRITRRDTIKPAERAALDKLPLHDLSHSELREAYVALLRTESAHVVD